MQTLINSCLDFQRVYQWIFVYFWLSLNTEMKIKVRGISIFCLSSYKFTTVSTNKLFSISFIYISVQWNYLFFGPNILLLRVHCICFELENWINWQLIFWTLTINTKNVNFAELQFPQNTFPNFLLIHLNVHKICCNVLLFYVIKSMTLLNNLWLLFSNFVTIIQQQIASANWVENYRNLINTGKTIINTFET